MSFHDKLRTKLRTEEDVRGKPYDDKTGKELKAPFGNVTIGVGHNLDANPLDEFVIEYLYQRDIEKILPVVDEIFPEWDEISENRQVAIVAMLFQLGVSGFLEFERFIAAVKAKQWGKASEELFDSDFYRQVPKRVGKLIRMISKDEYPYEQN